MAENKEIREGITAQNVLEGSKLKSDKDFRLSPSRECNRDFAIP